MWWRHAILASGYYYYEGSKLQRLCMQNVVADQINSPLQLWGIAAWHVMSWTGNFQNKLISIRLRSGGIYTYGAGLGHSSVGLDVVLFRDHSLE